MYACECVCECVCVFAVCSPSGLITSAARLFPVRATAGEPGDDDVAVFRSPNPMATGDEGDVPDMTTTLRGFIVLSLPDRFVRSSSFPIPITDDKGPKW